jgi:hypothetical protein
MTRSPILDPKQSYTFSNFFELNADPEEIFAELGCGLRSTALTLPRNGHYRDINLYAVPANLKDLIEILMGIIRRS